MMRIVIFCVALMGLSGCAAQQRNVEMPYGLEETDALRPSPCACVEYTEYNNRFLIIEG